MNALEKVIVKLIDAGIEIDDQSRSVRGYDPHGNTKLTEHEYHTLKATLAKRREDEFKRDGI